MNNYARSIYDDDSEGFWNPMVTPEEADYLDEMEAANKWNMLEYSFGCSSCGSDNVVCDNSTKYVCGQCGADWDPIFNCPEKPDWVTQDDESAWSWYREMPERMERIAREIATAKLLAHPIPGLAPLHTGCSYCGGAHESAGCETRYTRVRC